jgi:hypothetical protein
VAAEGNGGGKGIPGWVWIVVVLVVSYFLLQKTEKAAKQAVGGTAKELGKGIGQGAVSSAASALGSFIGSLTKSSSSHATSSAFKADTSSGITDSDVHFSAASSDDLIDPDVVDEVSDE